MTEIVEGRIEALLGSRFGRSGGLLRFAQIGFGNLKPPMAGEMMKTAIYYDDDAKPGSATYENVSGLIHKIRSTLGDEFSVSVEWHARDLQYKLRILKQKPDVLILDVVNDRPGTQIDKDNNCGLELAKLAHTRWPQVPIVFLTKLDGPSVQRMAAEEIRSFRNWVEKNNQSTLTLLELTLLRLFGPDERVRIGRLTLVPKETKIFWRNTALTLDDGLTPTSYKFLSTMIKITYEKRRGGAGNDVVTYDELRGDEDISDTAIHSRMHDAFVRLKEVEEKDYGRPLQRKNVFVKAGMRAYRIAEGE